MDEGPFSLELMITIVNCWRMGFVAISLSTNLTYSNRLEKYKWRLTEEGTDEKLPNYQLKYRVMVISGWKA